jgi:hypothetical protein
LIKIWMLATIAPDFLKGSYDQPWISLSTASGPPGGDLGQTSARLQSDPYLFSNFGRDQRPMVELARRQARQRLLSCVPSKKTFSAVIGWRLARQ